MRKFLPLLISFLSLILIFNLSREVVRLSKAGQRIEEARDKVQELKLENWQLKKELDYRQTDEFLEQEIRNKLGMAKKDETIVILPRETVEKFASQAATRVEEKQLSSWQQWLEIFW